MMKQELLSVIVPVYNVEKFLDTGIKSIVNQTYHNLEIILIDDGSADDSLSICQRWQKQDSRIKCFHFEQSGGAVKARQKGLEMSTADYITYVDSDDWVELDAFEKMMKSILENDADLVISTGILCEYEGGCTKPKDNIKPGVYTGDEIYTICQKMIHEEIYLTLWNRVFKKSKHMPYQMKTDVRIRVTEDIACMLMTIAHADRVAVIDEYLYHYVKNVNSIVHTYRSDYLDSNCLTYGLVKEELISTGKESLIHEWQRLILDKLLMNVRLECSRENKVSVFIKMAHLRSLYDKPVIAELVQENNNFCLTGREKVMWYMMQKHRTWILYFYLKVNAVKCLIAEHG